MERPMIIFLAVLVWAFFIFLNITWCRALKQKRGWFAGSEVGDNGAEIIAMIILAPLAFVILLIMTYTPPTSDWLKTKIEKII